MIIRTIEWIIFFSLVLVIFGFARSIQLHYSNNQKIFAAAQVPTPLLNGFYRGDVDGYKFYWQGKKFDEAKGIGINIFDGKPSHSEKYPFRTYIGKGILDKKTDVLKIEYNLPQNHFWMKPVLDELVQVAPGTYLGKMHVRLIPGFPFTLAFFELKQ